MKKIPKMLVTVLGCGTSVGVPMIGRILPHHSQHKNQRLRASILVEPFGRGQGSILIDTSPDLRQQALRFFPKKNPRLDAVLLTHEHADHLHGIDDVRAFNFLQNAPIPFFGEARCIEAIEHRFSYIFHALQIGGGLPKLILHKIATNSFYVDINVDKGNAKRVRVTPLPLIHGKISCLGFRIGNFAYITDLSEIPESTLQLLGGLDTLILDCLRPLPHPTHLHVEKSLEYAQAI
jgi:phosphoribosyl 1,2-cyclic phosphate phosphodiesterase